MSTHVAVIKGTESQAIEACRAHGIAVDSTHAVMDGKVTLNVSTEMLTIAEWFNEAPHKAPFPVGTLLWWRDS